MFYNKSLFQMTAPWKAKKHQVVSHCWPWSLVVSSVMGLLRSTSRRNPAAANTTRTFWHSPRRKAREKMIGRKSHQSLVAVVFCPRRPHQRKTRAQCNSSARARITLSLRVRLHPQPVWTIRFWSARARFTWLRIRRRRNRAPCNGWESAVEKGEIDASGSASRSEPFTWFRIKKDSALPCFKVMLDQTGPSCTKIVSLFLHIGDYWKVTWYCSVKYIHLKSRSWIRLCVDYLFISRMKNVVFFFLYIAHQWKVTW